MARPRSFRSASRRGFTFAEILAAMIFIAILVPVAVQGVTIANRAGVVALRKRQAAELANGILAQQAIENTWRTQPQQDGDFGEDWPGFGWALAAQVWANDGTMQELAATVTFRVQEREYRVVLSTLVPTEEPAATATSSETSGLTAVQPGNRTQ